MQNVAGVFYRKWGEGWGWYFWGEDFLMGLIPVTFIRRFEKTVLDIGLFNSFKMLFCCYSHISWVRGNNMCCEIAANVYSQTDSIWTIVSAIGTLLAALFAAAAAWLMANISHRNEMEAARPELVLDGWQRALITYDVLPDEKSDEFLFNRISNVGNGTAYNVIINIFDRYGNDHLHHPPFSYSTIAKPILQKGTEQQINGKMRFLWQQVEMLNNSKQKQIHFEIRMSFYCALKNFYQTTYSFYAIDKRHGIDMTFKEEIASGVYMTFYSVRCYPKEPKWKIYFFKPFRKLRNLISKSEPKIEV